MRAHQRQNKAKKCKFVVAFTHLIRKREDIVLVGEASVHLINPLRACIEPSARVLSPNTLLAVHIRLYKPFKHIEHVLLAS